YLGLPHVVARFSSLRQPAFEERFLEQTGHSRLVQVVASSHTVLPFLVAGTRRIATLQKRHARLAARTLPLRVLSSPIAIPPIREMLQWHSMNNSDGAVTWVRDALISHYGTGNT